ncbi:MAG: HAD-IIIA family hydrolase, partial [Deltaproteobacteria bacterium]|nr:HAD-IIIA family hydrolase [Deltaproteobacteria bacterium]
LRLLQHHGLAIAVVTNQSAVARGLLSEGDLSGIHREIERRLAEAEAFLDAIYYCPHHPTEGYAPYRMVCACRKPNTGLALRAAVELDLDLGRSYVVGDQWTDMELAARIGAQGILISDRRRETDRGPGTGDRPPSSVSGRFSVPVAGPRSSVFVANDLWEAAQWIVRDFGQRMANGK